MSPASRQSIAFFTSDSIPANDFATISGFLSRRRARPSTMTRVLAGGPATATASVRSRPEPERARCPLPRTYLTHPPWAAAQASTPDGLPWNTRSQAMAASTTRPSSAIGLALAARRRRARPRRQSPPSRPSPTPGGICRVTSTLHTGAPTRMASSSAPKPRPSSVSSPARAVRSPTRMEDSARGSRRGRGSTIETHSDRGYAVDDGVLAEQDRFSGRGCHRGARRQLRRSVSAFTAPTSNWRRASGSRPALD